MRHPHTKVPSVEINNKIKYQFIPFFFPQDCFLTALRNGLDNFDLTKHFKTNLLVKYLKILNL